jgi:hypothetical protein
MRSSLLLILLGIVFALAVEGGVWLVASDCRTNHLTIISDLPRDLTAKVSVGAQQVWAGRGRNTLRADFIKEQSGEGNFTVATGNGLTFERGYLESFDGFEHVLIIEEERVSYGPVSLGLLHEAKDRLRCAAQGRFR